MSERRFNERESILAAKRGVFSAINELFAEQPERVFLREGVKVKKDHVARWAVLTTQRGISYLVDVDTKHNEQGVLQEYTVEARVINLDALSIRNNRVYEDYSIRLTSDLMSNAVYSAKYRSPKAPVHVSAPVIEEDSHSLTIAHLQALQDQFTLSTLEHEEDAIALIRSEVERKACPTPEQLEKLVQIATIDAAFPYRED